MINGRAAPIQYVSATQISVIVPYFTESIAQIQVINNNVTSNTATELTNQTSPGIFTYGAGYADALHSNFSLVSTSSPAQIGETIQVYLTGLGAVTPPVADGAPGSGAPPYNTATNPIAADVDGTAATVTFQGLAPGFAGVYQLNVTIPTGLSAGDHFLDISGPDSYNSQALVSIGAGSAAAAQPAMPAPNHRVVRPANPSRRFHGSTLPRDLR
jgi:adhesin/invasin